MACIRKRGAGQWQAQIRRRGYPEQSKTFSTRAAAEKWARAIEAEMDTGSFVSRREAETTTLKELLKRYLEEVTPRKKGAESEAHRLSAMMRSPLACLFIANIRGKHIAAWRDDRLTVVSNSTVKRDLVLLGHVFEVARKEWGIHASYPVRDIRLPSDGKPRDRRLRADEEVRLLEACARARNSWLLPLVELAIETGMRRSELLALEWTRIDLKKRIAVLADTKNGHPRCVPLSTKAVKILRRLKNDEKGAVFEGVTGEASNNGNSSSGGTDQGGLEEVITVAQKGSGPRGVTALDAPSGFMLILTAGGGAAAVDTTTLSGAAYAALHSVPLEVDGIEDPFSSKDSTVNPLYVGEPDTVAMNTRHGACVPVCGGPGAIRGGAGAGPTPKGLGGGGSRSTGVPNGGPRKNPSGNLDDAAAAARVQPHAPMGAAGTRFGD